MNRYKIIGQQINNDDDVTDQIDRTRSIRQYVYVMTKGKLFGFGCNIEILISKKLSLSKIERIIINITHIEKWNLFIYQNTFFLINPRFKILHETKEIFNKIRVKGVDQFFLVDYTKTRMQRYSLTLLLLFVRKKFFS